MPFVKVKGVEGLVWALGTQDDEKKKHPCTDCYCCAWCSDERCRVCLSSKKKSCKKKNCKRK